MMLLSQLRKESVMMNIFDESVAETMIAIVMGTLTKDEAFELAIFI